MQIKTQPKQFNPVTIVVETRQEALLLMTLVNMQKYSDSAAITLTGVKLESPEALNLFRTMCDLAAALNEAVK